MRRAYAAGVAVVVVIALAAAGIVAGPLASHASPSPSAPVQRSASPIAPSGASGSLPVASTATPAGTRVIAPTATPTATPAPTTAEIDAAGPFTGNAGHQRGSWAVRGTRLFLSQDGMAWSEGTIPPLEQPEDIWVSPTTFVDMEHGWTLRPAPGSQVLDHPNDPLAVVLYRTGDGGKTWASWSLPGNFRGMTPQIVFADPDNGYIVATDAQSPARIYRTKDGGGTWKLVGQHSLYDGWLLSDPNTVWTYSRGNGVMCFNCKQPLLQVSRDGGATWTTVRLKGYETRVTGEGFGVAGVDFVSPAEGYVAIHEGTAYVEGPATTTVLKTTDGGLTWSKAGKVGIWLDEIWTFDATHWVGLEEAWAVASTADGGATWEVARGPDADHLALASTWFIDPSHALNWVDTFPTNDTMARLLYVSTTGGRTWVPAQLPK